MQNIFTFIQTHWLLNLLFFVLLFAVIAIEYVNQRRRASGLSPSQLVQLINQNDATIIDIRDKAAFNSGHIIGAVSIPFSDLANKTKLLEKKTQPAVIICDNGTQAQRAADELQQKGLYTKILSGGMRAWREAEMPVVKE